MVKTKNTLHYRCNNGVPCKYRVPGCKDCYKCPLLQDGIGRQRGFELYVVSHKIGNVEYLRKLNEPPMSYSVVKVLSEGGE